MTAVVVAGCPVRGREWIVGEHVRALAGQSARPNHLAYLVNGPTAIGLASTTDAIQAALLAREGVGLRLYAQWNSAGYERSGEHTYRDDEHAHLAFLRNEWVRVVLRDCPHATHLWMVDSDVVPEPDTLELLLAADKDIIAAPVKNGRGGVYNFMLAKGEDGEPRRSRSGHEGLHLSRDEQPFLATLVGACTLVKREVLEGKDAPRFGPHPRGEDFPFCAAARAAGYTLWVHPKARTTHHMTPGEPGLRSWE